MISIQDVIEGRAQIVYSPGESVMPVSLVEWYMSDSSAGILSPGGIFTDEGGADYWLCSSGLVQRWRYSESYRGIERISDRYGSCDEPGHWEDYEGATHSAEFWEPEFCR